MTAKVRGVEHLAAEVDLRVTGELQVLATKASEAGAPALEDDVGRHGVVLAADVALVGDRALARGHAARWATALIRRAGAEDVAVAVDQRVQIARAVGSAARAPGPDQRGVVRRRPTRSARRPRRCPRRSGSARTRCIPAACPTMTATRTKPNERSQRVMTTPCAARHLRPGRWLEKRGEDRILGARARRWQRGSQRAGSSGERRRHGQARAPSPPASSPPAGGRALAST